MISLRQIRAVLNPWFAWKRKRRLYRSIPELRYFDEQERLARRQHQPVAHIRAAKTAAMTAALKGEV